MSSINDNTKKGIIHWGIIGCGDVTEVKSGPAFNKVPNSTLVAVMRRNKEKAADYAKRHNVADSDGVYGLTSEHRWESPRFVETFPVER